MKIRPKSNILFPQIFGLAIRGVHGQDQDWISYRILAIFLKQDWIWIIIFKENWIWILVWFL